LFDGKSCHVCDFVVDLMDGSTGEDTAALVVPEGCYFMLGDYRDNSADSCFDVVFFPLRTWLARPSACSGTRAGSTTPIGRSSDKAASRPGHGDASWVVSAE